ncbi:type IV pilus modification PilV family protein [Noviherbaspirillum aridicola]|nr:prepilin-type N-terminal cleavage/methylation domain-containing protein [Noviherbaspirillum aridicola]
MLSHSRREPARRQSGVTLVELVISIVIIGIGVAGILQVLSLTTQRSADPLQRKQALAIAEGLMEEVRLARFTYCDPADPAAATATSAAGCATAEQAGPEAGNARPFDNVNDYVAEFDKDEPYSADAAGNPHAGTIGAYTASVTIRPDAALGPVGGRIASGSTPAQMEVLRITVTVRYNNGNDSVVLDGYRTRYAPQALP